MFSFFTGYCEFTYILVLLSVDEATGIVEMDLLAGTLAGNGCFNIGWLSVVSVLALLLMTVPLSFDNDLLTGGDGDLPFPELTNFSSLRRVIFGIESLSINDEGNLDLLCLPEEQLLD